MGQVWRYLLSHPYLVFVIITVIFSIVGRIVKVLTAQAEQRRIAQAKARAEMESLRTGRAVEAEPSAARQAQAPPPSARESLEEMARRRQGEIAQRRTQRPARPIAQSRQPRPPRPVTRSAPRPTTPSVPTSARQPRGDRGIAAAPPAGRSGTLNIPTQPTRSPERPSAERGATAQVQRRAEEIQPEQHKQRIAEGSPAEIVKQRANAQGLRPELRRAVIMQEVLSPPLSLR